MRGSTREMDSTSSSRNSIRTTRPSSCPGNISTASPRTRKVPLAKSTSPRRYWMETSLPKSSSRSMRSPTNSMILLLLVLVRRPDPVDAAHAGDHDHVVALREARGGAVAEAVDLVVDGRVLLDVGVAGGDVGLGLVVVVIGHEVFHGVLGKELLELRVELGREGLVVRKDQGPLAQVLDDVGHGEGLPGPRDPQEGVFLFALFQESLGQRRDRRRLVALGLELGDQLEFGFSLAHGRGV